MRRLRFYCTVCGKLVIEGEHGVDWPRWVTDRMLHSAQCADCYRPLVARPVEPLKRRHLLHRIGARLFGGE
jgi:hypothetical protein